jgi:hypothetical protein
MQKFHCPLLFPRLLDILQDPVCLRDRCPIARLYKHQFWNTPVYCSDWMNLLADKQHILNRLLPTQNSKHENAWTPEKMHSILTDITRHKNTKFGLIHTNLWLTIMDWLILVWCIYRNIFINLVQKLCFRICNASTNSPFRMWHQFIPHNASQSTRIFPFIIGLSVEWIWRF